MSSSFYFSQVRSGRISELVQNTKCFNAFNFLKILSVQWGRCGYVLYITLASPRFVTTVISTDSNPAKLEKNMHPLVYSEDPEKQPSP